MMVGWCDDVARCGYDRDVHACRAADRSGSRIFPAVYRLLDVAMLVGIVSCCIGRSHRVRDYRRGVLMAALEIPACTKRMRKAIDAYAVRDCGVAVMLMPVCRWFG